MKENPNFRFTANVSLDTYEKKSDAIACLSKAGASAIGKNKMAFKEQNVTIAEFLSLATSGHTFCNLFDFDPNTRYWISSSSGKAFQSYPVYKKGPNIGGMKLSFKADCFFKGSQAIFVDVDYTKYQSIQDYLNTLTYPPSCVYMSYSDNVEKRGIRSRRFRLVYVLDQIVGNDDFVRISGAINDQIIIDTAEPMEDDCGKRRSQYMNGVYGNNETYLSNYVYSVADFPSSAPDYEMPLESNTERDISFDERLLSDMGSMEYDVFMHCYSTRFYYVYRTEKTEWIDECYQMTDENYLQLWYYREKQVDGQKRRRKLFKNACLRRLMYPDIDAETLLFNLYVDFVRFFDNSDSVIQLSTLTRKVKNAMLMSYDQLTAFCDMEIRYWKENRPRFICKPGTKTTWGQIRNIMKNIRWAEIDLVYDRTKTIKENIDSLAIPSSTLYRYCDERGINLNPNRPPSKAMKEKDARTKKLRKIELFKALYDPNKTIRQNQDVFQANGLDISAGSISSWIKRYYEKPTQTFTFPPISFEPLDLGSFDLENYSSSIISSNNTTDSQNVTIDMNKFIWNEPIPVPSFASEDWIW